MPILFALFLRACADDSSQHSDLHPGGRHRPAGARFLIVAGVTDLLRNFTGLSGLVQTTLKQIRLGVSIYIFRGRKGNLVNILWHDGDGPFPLQKGSTVYGSNGRKRQVEYCR